MSRLRAMVAGHRYGDRRFLAALADARLAQGEYDGIHPEDILEQARATLRAVVRGRGGPSAVARAKAARFVLSRGFLRHLTDEQMVFEVKRRADAHEPKEAVSR